MLRVVLDLFAGFGDREAIVSGGRRLSFTELPQLVLDLAAGLRQRGVGGGTGVLVVGGSQLELPALQLALHLLGARSCWISPVTAPREIEQFARLSQADVIIHEPDRSELAERLHRALGGQLPMYPLGPDLCLAGPWDPAFDAPEPITCLQTSGTTGVPKLVHHRAAFYEQVLALATEYRAAGGQLLRHLSHSPMGLASGQITCFFNLFTGGVLFLEEQWDAGRCLATIERERITSAYVSPPLLYELLDHPDLDRTDCTSLGVLHVGAGPATPTRLRQAIKRFGPIVRIVYGLSEVIVVTHQPGLTADRPERLRSAGTPFGDARVEVRGEDGRVLGPRETGEIWATSRLAFAGYWGRPDLTERALVDGWVRTGDLGYRDEDGYLYLVDRVQDAIVTGRSNWTIYSRPIEDILAAVPGVRGVAVIGVPSPTYGEEPHAYVVRDSTQPTEQQLIAAVTTELNDLWAPGGVTFVESLPLTSAGKIDKQALRGQYEHR